MTGFGLRGGKVVGRGSRPAKKGSDRDRVRLTNKGCFAKANLKLTWIDSAMR